MYLSTETVALLKNFSTINQSILIKAGKKIRSMSVMKNILVEADIDEEFSRDVAIYDLNEFLATLSLFNNPDLDFQDDYVVLSEEGSGVKEAARSLVWHQAAGMLQHAGRKCGESGFVSRVGVVHLNSFPMDRGRF